MRRTNRPAPMARRNLSRYLALAGILLVGALLRLYALHALPPGLYQDEAVEGFDALRVLRGEFPIYFESNNGREPAFMYLLAAGITFMGRTPLALRAISALAGTVAIPITYQAVRVLFGRRTALLAAFIFATTFWPIQVSRLGLRSSLLPAALAMAIWSTARAWRTHQARDWLLAGALCALSLYTYLPARLVLLVPAAIVLAGALTGIDWRKVLRGGARFCLAYGLVALPLVLYAMGHWEVFNGRASQVSLLNPDINHGRLLPTLLDQGLIVARMFLVEGDRNLRHNLPGRPVFDWLVGVAFVLGVVVGLRHWRQRRWQLVGAWLVVFLAPTLLTDSAPHYLRAYGVWPLLAVVPAAGLEAGYAVLKRRVGVWAAVSVAGAVLAGSLFATVRDYVWRDYLTSRAAYYAFDAFATDLAVDVNRFRGYGWQGTTPGEAVPPGDVWIEPRLYRFTKTVEFLAPPESSGQSALHLLEPGGVIPSATQGLVRLIVVPGEETRYLPLLPPKALITIADGALAKADVEVTPFLLYRVISTSPAEDLPEPFACFEGGVALLPPQVVHEAGGLLVELRWLLEIGAAPAHTVFLHAYQDGALVAQNDSAPAGGRFPFNWLRPGDVIRDIRALQWDPASGSAETIQLGIGLYDPSTGIRHQATDCAGQAMGDEVLIR